VSSSFLLYGSRRTIQDVGLLSNVLSETTVELLQKLTGQRVFLFEDPLTAAGVGLREQSLEVHEQLLPQRFEEKSGYRLTSCKANVLPPTTVSSIFCTIDILVSAASSGGGISLTIAWRVPSTGIETPAILAPVAKFSTL